MNAKVGSFYLLACLILAISALLLRPFGLILLWPAASLFLVGSGYFGLGAKVYYKQNGKIHPVARVLHAFTLLGHELSRRHYARQCNPWDRLTPNLWIGRQLDTAEAHRLAGKGVTAVLDLTAEFSEPAPLLRLNYLNLPVLDLTAPAPDQLDAAIAFIEHESREGIVYIHCKIGYSRTAAVAGNYLLSAGIAPFPDDALRHLRASRPTIVIRHEAETAIRKTTRAETR